jgi:ligand-binding sensor domain-containing protein
MTIGVLIFLSGCGVVFRKESFQDGIELTTAPTFTLRPPSSTSTLTPESHLFLATPNIASTELDSSHWTHFTSPIDILQSDVQHIGQAEDGTMWFGGRNIYHYDGEDWTIYDQRAIPAIRGSIVISLAIAPNRTIWFGTDMNEIVSFNGTTWTSQTVEDGGYRENWITSIVIRRNGELCAISIEGMSCRNKGNWIRHPIVISDTAGRVYVKKAVLTSTDEIWVPVDNGFLYHYDGENWESSKVSSWICCIASSQDGSLWFFGHEGFGKRDIDGNIAYKWAPAIILRYVTTIKEANDGTLWIGTGGGLQVVRYVNGVFVTVDGIMVNSSGDERNLFDVHGFPFYHIHNIFQAKDGSIWLGTVGGIFRFK